MQSTQPSFLKNNYSPQKQPNFGQDHSQQLSFTPPIVHSH